MRSPTRPQRSKSATVALEVEEEGAERASHALKLLQREKALSVAATGKDPQTRRLETQTDEVNGPVAIVLTTTAAEIEPGGARAAGPLTEKLHCTCQAA